MMTDKDKYIKMLQDRLDAEGIDINLYDGWEDWDIYETETVVLREKDRKIIARSRKENDKIYIRFTVDGDKVNKLYRVYLNDENIYSEYEPAAPNNFTGKNEKKKHMLGYIIVGVILIGAFVGFVLVYSLQ